MTETQYFRAGRWMNLVQAQEHDAIARGEKKEVVEEVISPKGVLEAPKVKKVVEVPKKDLKPVELNLKALRTMCDEKGIKWYGFSKEKVLKEKLGL